MKSTEYFKNVIQCYLEHRASCDELFAVLLAKPNKDIDACITYILNTVQQSGCNGFADDEIYSMAVHFWIEDDIEVGNPVDCFATVNHVVELSEEEKVQARKDAVQRVQNETYSKMMQPKRKATSKREKETNVQQMKLF